MRGKRKKAASRQYMERSVRRRLTDMDYMGEGEETQASIPLE